MARKHTSHAAGVATAGMGKACDCNSGSHLTRCSCHLGQVHNRWIPVSCGPSQHEQVAFMAVLCHCTRTTVRMATASKLRSRACSISVFAMVNPCSQASRPPLDP